jgi:hypothetical protein
MYQFCIIGRKMKMKMKMNIYLVMYFNKKYFSSHS